MSNSKEFSIKSSYHSITYSIGGGAIRLEEAQASPEFEK
jgi:hypothetical protein